MIVYRRNGRTISIPVQKPSPQLPAAQEEPRPLLAEKTACEEVEAQAQDWQEQALRWQAEAENVRKRADRRAEVQIQRERRRLLSHLLTVADNLERALAHADGDAPLHAGGTFAPGARGRRTPAKVLAPRPPYARASAGEIIPLFFPHEPSRKLTQLSGRLKRLTNVRFYDILLTNGR